MQLIGWTLIHSLWEGGAIALLLALAFSATRRSPASVRYALGMIGLAAMVALPVATTVRMATLSAAQGGTVTLSADETGVLFGSATTTTSTDDLRSIAANPAKTPATVSRTTGRAEPEARSTSQSVAAARKSLLAKLEPSLPWLVGAWLIGLVLLSIRMIGGVARTRRIVRDGTTPASDDVLRLVSRISDSLRLRQAVSAVEGIHLTVPVVIGWLRPVIVLPASLVTGLTPWQLEMLLAHELAHIRRYDFLANTVQTVIETLLFFHPAAWWLSDRIREERENCCDDIAIAACGGDRKGYTAALLALEESRDDDFAFAAAATGGGNGGTLFRRAMRLMTGGPAHIDLGARWIAGVITILAALFTTGPAMGRAADLSMASRIDVLGFLAQESDTLPHGVKAISDPARSNPDTVLRYSGTGSLAERWRWAEQRARSLRSSRYWIGYLVAGDPTGRQMYYSDRETPVRSGTSSFMGRMYIGNASGLEFSGSPLAPLVGSHAPTSVAVFLEFDRARNERLSRVHVGSFVFPVYFGGGPVLWLDSATDVESVAKLRALATSAQPIEIRRDLVSAVGVHRDVNATLRPLIGWLESRDEPEGVRREAAEALGHVPDGRALTVLARVARNDRSRGVRHEAIEAFEGMRLAAATDTLMAFATSLESSDLRGVAIESLGARHEPRVVALLKRIASGSDDRKLRMDAVEALGSMHEEGFTAIADLARNASDADVRREAIEELANSEPAGRALDILREIIRSDPDRSVRLEAVETLAEVHDDRAAATLRDLVMRSADPAVQVKATEALGDVVQSDNNVRELVALAQTHPRTDVRKEAIETLGDVHELSAGSALVAIARSDADPELRRAAIEALGEQHNEAALDAVRAVAQAGGPEHVRRQAMETYSEKADPEVAVAFLKSIIARDPSERIRLNALEILSEMDHDAGIPAIRELARSSSDMRVRNRAQEILSEH